MESFTYGKSYNCHYKSVNIPLEEEFSKRTGLVLQAMGGVFRLTERRMAHFALVLENADNGVVSSNRT